jgi:hypothetical protein
MCMQASYRADPDYAAEYEPSPELQLEDHPSETTHCTDR